jgi:glycosyltransferase involved in cell wall biosynthesis
MRIVCLTAGTGSFYCGTCIRDNALVLELRRRGHDALCVPMYLEPMLDEAPATGGAPLFYGGINVYLQQKLGLFRKTPRWVDQLFDAPALLRAAAQKSGMTSARDLTDITLSMLKGEEGHQVKELDRLAHWLSAEWKPDAILLSQGLLIGLARRLREATAAPVLCFLNGEDSFLDSVPDADSRTLWEAFASRVADVDLFLPVSRYYADVMGERGRIPLQKLEVLYPGITLEAQELATFPKEPTVGYLSRMCRAKGLHTLVDAFIRLRKSGRVPQAKLRVAGSMTASDRPFVEELKSRLAAEGLAGDAEFLPNLDRAEKLAFLQSLSVFSVPATYGESFGLYLLEALSAAVPVVQPRHAAFPELLDLTGGGLLCEPDNPASLATGLETLLLDPERARALGEQGRVAVEERFSVGAMTEAMERVLRQVGSAPAPKVALQH